MIKWLTINGMVETFCLQLFTRTYHFVKLSAQKKKKLAKQTHILKKRSPYKPARKSIRLYKNGSLNGHHKK